jgi:excisionase family DNA binding protein
MALERARKAGPEFAKSICFVYRGFRLFRLISSILKDLSEPDMASTTLPKMTLPVEREVQAAVQGQRALAAVLATRLETQHIQIFDDKNQAHQVELPTSALRLLLDILAELAEGNAVKVVPVHAELTTQEAADMLNVSRPHLVKLLEAGVLPFHKTGKHRRVRFADLMQFKAQRDRASEDAMAQLAKQAQALAMGYD